VRLLCRNRLIVVVVLCAATTGAPIAAAAQVSVKSAAHAIVRNPRALRATQLLEQRSPGTLARVRFEWDQVSGAHEYVVTGRWTAFPSWTIQTREYHVTRGNATSWNAEHVTFDVSLPEGGHSWQIVALFGPKNDGDYAKPTSFSFDLR
jgi:hypothetical protein